MISGFLKVVAFAATTAVALPYTAALLCNLAYGWPRVQNKFRRAFGPKKVFALNFSLIQKLIISIKYLPLYLQWKAYYKLASAADIMKDKAYGRNDQTLDLYFPKNRGMGDTNNYPVVVFVYGGAWGSGSKNMYGLLCSAVANKLGVIVCCPNHSTYPQGYVDDMVQDIVDCISWLYQNIEQYNGDKNKIMLIGHSSGAHLCAMSMLELLHDELIEASTVDLQPVTTSTIQFSDRHFGSTDNNEDRQSSASSGSFCVIDGKNDNGHQSDGQSNSAASSGHFEVLSTQKSETEHSEASMLESELLELSQSDITGIRFRRRTSLVEGAPGGETESDKGETSGLKEGKSGSFEDDDSGDNEDNESVVTVKSKEIDAQMTDSDIQPSLLNLSKSIKAVVGLAGVYDISDHFEHESMRGVEDVSTMARSMYGNQHFDRFSPTYILQNINTPLRFPKILLIHGTDDYVVPLSSTTKFGEELKRLNGDVTVRIIPSCDHYEVCLDLMLPRRKFNKTVMTLVEDVAKSAFS